MSPLSSCIQRSNKPPCRRVVADMDDEGNGFDRKAMIRKELYYEESQSGFWAL